jgi:hypothetical protein
MNYLTLQIKCKILFCVANSSLVKQCYNTRALNELSDSSKMPRDFA